MNSSDVKNEKSNDILSNNMTKQPICTVKSPFELHLQSKTMHSLMKEKSIVIKIRNKKLNKHSSDYKERKEIKRRDENGPRISLHNHNKDEYLKKKKKNVESACDTSKRRVFEISKKDL